MRSLVILLGLYPATHGQTVGRFRYVEKYGAYLLDGAPMRPSQLNELMAGKGWEKLVEEYGARVRVKLIPHNDMQKARAALPPTAKVETE